MGSTARFGICVRIAVVALVLTIIDVTAARAMKLPAYSDTVLAEWQQRYPRGILSNYNEVILPRLNSDEQQALKGVRFEFPLRLSGREPFAFAADSAGRTIYMSVQSLKFLDDLNVAIAWLNRNSYTQESVNNYLTMLRNWNDEATPPLPLDALCIPKDALDNKDVDSLSQKGFATAVVFVMLHEVGHVLFRHGGYQGIDPAVARAREEEADAFALRVMARIGDAPLGVVNLFLTMAYLHESRTDFSSDGDYETRLAARTHPLSAERLRKFAITLQDTAADYTGSGLSRVQIAATALQVNTVAASFLDIQRLIALTGPSIRPKDLGPMRSGDKLSRPCSDIAYSKQPFSGRFNGTVTVNNVEFDMDAELRRSGDRVSGRSSYGLGVSTLEGVIDGDMLRYRWRLNQDTGSGILRYSGGEYHGSWGLGETTDDGGTMRLLLE